jgi:DNA-binding CsgD family transcriptional regulator
VPRPVTVSTAELPLRMLQAVMERHWMTRVTDKCIFGGQSAVQPTAAPEKQSSPSAGAGLRIDGRDAFDCFNEDLAWILGKLVNRTGGIAGVISGHLSDDVQAVTLASEITDSEPTELTALLISRGVSAPDCQTADPDEPVVSHCLLQIRPNEQVPRRYRVLQLSFKPAIGVKVVATVAKDSRRGFRFLEEAAAVRLYPVLSRYVRLWWLHRVERRRAHTLSVIAEMSDLGIVLLNRNGRVLFANSHARLMLQARDGLASDNEMLQATSPADQEKFAHALSHARGVNRIPRDNRSAARVSQILHLARPSGRRNMIVAVMPVGPPATDEEDTSVIVYGLDPDQDVAELLAPVCSIYGLSPAEARVVRLLITGCRITDAARVMEIQPQTARAYLKRIFAKTRTHRQADLVRIMLSSALRTTASIDGTM